MVREEAKTEKKKMIAAPAECQRRRDSVELVTASSVSGGKKYSQKDDGIVLSAEVPRDL